MSAGACQKSNSFDSGRHEPSSQFGKFRTIDSWILFVKQAGFTKKIHWQIKMCRHYISRWTSCSHKIGKFCHSVHDILLDSSFPQEVSKLPQRKIGNLEALNLGTDRLLQKLLLNMDFQLTKARNMLDKLLRSLYSSIIGGDQLKKSDLQLGQRFSESIVGTGWQ